MARTALISVPGSDAAATRSVAGPGPRTWVVAGLVAGGGFVPYVAMRVMVTIPRLGRDDALRHWPVALLGAAVVALGAAVVVSWTSARRHALTGPEAHS